jgi:hypothetical protein
MRTYMSGIEIALTVLGLFVGMLLCTALGRRIGRSRLRRKTEEADPSLAVLEGGVFGLMGLLIALTFSISASRLEVRRQIVVDEANAIGTAWLRVGLLPNDRQDAMRQQFRRYVDSRLTFYRDITNLEAAARALKHTNTLQGEIWSQGVADCAETPTVAAAMLFLPALNLMIDLTTTGTMMAKNHLPLLIRILLVFSPMVCAVLAGMESAPRTRRVWMPTTAFALTLSLTVYVILDLDYPRVGLIRIDPVDQAMVELRTSMEGSR